MNLLGKFSLKRHAANRALMSLYSFLRTGTLLNREYIGNALDDGYYKNPDCFSIINKLANKFANVTLVPYNGEKISSVDPLSELFGKNTSDLTLTEFKKTWYVYALCCGESMFYATKLRGGNNLGKINGQLTIIPPQFTEIESGGWRKPILNYTMSLYSDTHIKMPAEDVYHVRLFPNISTVEGRNLRGLSPLKVAADTIKSQNNGYELQKNISATGLPPGIIVDESLDQSSELRQKNLEAAWKRKAFNQNRRSLPVFGSGKLQFIELGYKSLKDMQTIESAEHGLRVLCNVLSVPSQIFNDTKGSTYNNMKTAYEALYNDRIMPDVNQFIDILNILFSDLGITYKADYKNVPELRMSPMDFSKMMLDGVVRGVAHENEWRNSMHLNELSEQELDELRVNRDRLNINQIENSSNDNSNDF